MIESPNSEPAKELFNMIKNYLKLNIVENYINYKMQNNKSLNYIAENLYVKFQDLSNNDKIELLNNLNNEFNEIEENGKKTAKKRLSDLKENLNLYAKSPKSTFWQDTLLNIETAESRDKKIDYLPNLVSNDYVDINDNKIKVNDETGEAKILGTTFRTGKDKGLTHKDEKGNDVSMILDASSNAIILNKKGEKILLGAIADGFGGHSDIQEDINIARTSKIACESAIKYMTIYADDLSKANEIQEKKIWGNILTNIQKDIQNGTKFESMASVAFHISYPKDGKYEVKGINIGDCMLASWNEKNGEFNTISPAEGLGRVRAPAPFPGHKEKDIKYFKETLPVGTKLFAMTDGVFDQLDPINKLIDDIDENGQKHGEFTRTYLDSQKMQKLFEGKNFSEIIHKINETVVNNTNEEYKKFKAGEIKKNPGDDATLITTTFPEIKDYRNKNINIQKNSQVKNNINNGKDNIQNDNDLDQNKTEKDFKTNDKIPTITIQGIKERLNNPTIPLNILKIEMDTLINNEIDKRLEGKNYNKDKRKNLEYNLKGKVTEKLDQFIKEKSYPQENIPSKDTENLKNDIKNLVELELNLKLYAKSNKEMIQNPKNIMNAAKSIITSKQHVSIKSPEHIKETKDAKIMRLNENAKAILEQVKEKLSPFKAKNEAKNNKDISSSITPKPSKTR